LKRSGLDSGLNRKPIVGGDGHSVDPEIDEMALRTVRTWKFKVTRGEQAGFAINFFTG